MLKDDEILAIVSNELSNADIAMTTGLSTLEQSLDLYLGNPLGNEVEGRSQVVSTDIADSIEWIMPQVMKSFTQQNEVVAFDPVHEGDERQADLESQYVYEVLMKQNDGFIIIHQMVKDALMQRNGVVKIYYAEKTSYKVSSYTGLLEQQVQQLLMAEGVELIEKTETIDQALTEQKQQQIQGQMQQLQQKGQQMMQQAQQVESQPTPPPQMDPQQIQQQQQQMQQIQQQMQQQMQQMQAEMQKPVMVFDIKVSLDRTKGKIYVDPVPPEEFRLNSNHNSINLDKARFTAHIVTKSASDIMDDYDLDKDEISELEGDTSDMYEKDYRFAAQDENANFDSDESEDPSQREIDVAECYMLLDVEETGIAKLMKIDVAGGDTPTRILSMDEIDSMPWSATTTFLMSHKFQGLSITDRLIQIQQHKTALWRNQLDNIYLQNNQRNIVIEGQVNMDDLLISRPGGIIRAKRLDAITPLPTPQISSDSFSMMEYLDRVRAGRTGVDADGQASPANIGDRVGSQGVERMMNAKEELVGLIIRVIAETGIKPLCIKIRDLSVQHIDAVLDFKFRGVWQQINPAQWDDRYHCTVRVGTGTGNHQDRIGALREVIGMQEKAMAFPGQYVIDEKRMFGAVDDFCKLSGLNGATKYFIDPESPEGIAKKQEEEQKAKEASQKNDQMQQAMAKSQLDLAQAEMDKVKVQAQNVQLKAQTDGAKNQLTLQKQTADAQINSLKAQLDQQKLIAEGIGKMGELELRQYDIDNRTAIELTRIEKDSEKDENKNFASNKETVDGA